MPEGAWSEWDFLTFVALWNLYGLPGVLGLVLGALLVWGRRHDAADSRREGVATVRRIGLIHHVIGLRALIALAQELLTLRTMGIFQSNPITGLIFPFVSMIVNPLLGIGLRRLRPGARRSALAWYVIWLFFAAWASYWIWRYGAPVSLADWPDHLVGKALPLVLLIVMLLPHVRRAFPSGQTRSDAEAEAGPLQAPTSNLGAGGSFFSGLVLLLLIVACSTLVVDAADWTLRLVAGPE
jgi:hypothetical protein